MPASKVVVCFNSGNNDVKHKLCSGSPCTAATSQNSVSISSPTDHQITIRELCTEMNSRFSALEMMVEVLECHKVCTKRVPWMFTQQQKEHHMQICLLYYPHPIGQLPQNHQGWKRPLRSSSARPITMSLSTTSKCFLNTSRDSDTTTCPGATWAPSLYPHQ